MNVIVSTCDKYLWCLRPFSYLFNKYWGVNQDVVVAGYTEPQFDLPGNFYYYTIDTPSYPKEKWADGVINFLDVFLSSNIPHDFGVFLLEDYWLCRKVDVQGILALEDYMRANPNVLRVDLTGDRLYAGGMHDAGHWDRFDIIEAPGSQYQMSLQAGLWNLKLLNQVLKLLPRNKRSAWDFELEGTSIIADRYNDFRVVGTRQWPIRYANAMSNSGHQVSYLNLDLNDIGAVQRYIPEEYR